MVTRCVSISAYAYLVGIQIGIQSSAVELKIYAITAGMKSCKSIIKKKKKEKHDQIVLSAKAKLNTIEVLIPRALIDSYISHDEFVLVKNVLREFDDINKRIRLQRLIKDFILLIKQCHLIV